VAEENARGISENKISAAGSASAARGSELGSAGISVVARQGVAAANGEFCAKARRQAARQSQHQRKISTATTKMVEKQRKQAAKSRRQSGDGAAAKAMAQQWQWLWRKAQ